MTLRFGSSKFILSGAIFLSPLMTHALASDAELTYQSLTKCAPTLDDALALVAVLTIPPSPPSH